MRGIADLPFPESMASAEIVKAGQAGATDAPKYVFGALGFGGLLQFLKDERGIQIFKDSVSGFAHFPKSVISYFYQDKPIGDVAYTGGIAYTTPSASPALIGIGYIIGPRLAAINFSGGVIAWLVLIPLILFVDPDLPTRLGGTMGGTAPWDVVSYTVWYNVVRPDRRGHHAGGRGLHALLDARVHPALHARRVRSLAPKAGADVAVTPLDIDIPIKWVLGSIAVLIVPITIIYYHFAGSWGAAILAAVIMTVSGFFLSAVGGYLVGLVGSSNQPVSGLTLAALVIAALLMVAIGVKGLGGVAAVLGVASVVCCACCVSGSLIQDLKAGYLLGGTPWKMEVVEVLSVTAVAFFLLVPIYLLDEAYRSSGGIGGRELPAPQAGLMAQLAQGIVGGQMAWGLLIAGCAFGIALVMIEAPSPMLIAVGMYLPLETTSAIFVGGAIRWLADSLARRRKFSPEENAKYEERGTLLASGFIAGEAILGIVLAAVFPKGGSFTHWLTGADQLAFLPAWGGWISLVAFAVIGYVLVRLPLRKKSA